MSKGFRNTHPDEVWRQLKLPSKVNTLLDIGCGYGTFLLPAAHIIHGTAIGLDIDGGMVTICKAKADEWGLQNVIVMQGDIADHDTVNSLYRLAHTIDFISLFNILHGEDPLSLLLTAHSLLSAEGKLGVIHWNPHETPRGPSLAIRPTPQQIMTWAYQADFALDHQVDLKPHHFGFVFSKN